MVEAGWGNGRASCVRFAQEGAHVLAVDLNLSSMDETIEMAKGSTGKIEPYVCDVTDEKSVETMVQACLDKFGKIDILVNSVGGSAKGGPVDMSLDVWNKQIQFNLSSVYLTFLH